jgi:exopolysaccharide biosynthesis polyprenyl glycosylphosphotransferase
MARMIRRDNLRSRVLHRCTDVGLIWAALAIAYEVKERYAIGIRTEPITPAVVGHTWVIIGLMWLATCSALETYTYKRRLFSEIVNLVAALAITIAFFNTYVYFTRLFVFPRFVMMFYAVAGAGLLILSRAVKHSVQRMLHRKGIGVRRVIIVGTGPTAQRLARSFRKNHALGYDFRGFVAESPDEVIGHCIGQLADLENLIREADAEEVIIALPGHHHQEILNIAHRCQGEHLRLRVVPDLFDVVMIRASLTEVEDIPLIGLRDPVITSYQSLVKRVFDVLVASFCLLLASPAFAIIAVAILLDTRGRVFFLQTRVGENGKPFRMYKFRSMVADAEQRLSELVKIDELPEPVFKLKNDPRVTRVGRFLRRTSLDELPQLINVLRGDMSMVGPRPEELQVVEHYQLWHRKRLSIKPGITGPMQVSGRGELTLDERIKLELMYISNYSILEDLKYLAKTIPAVCRARGAY